jgi:hypothetical protein
LISQLEAAESLDFRGLDAIEFQRKSNAKNVRSRRI